MTDDLARAIGNGLPYLRRYARALTGSQETGDGLAEAALQNILSNEMPPNPTCGEKIALFRTLHRVWAAAGAPLGVPDSRLSARAQGHMTGLTPNSREALLLNTIEGFGFDEIGLILGCPARTAETLAETALDEMARSVSGRILVIEDERIIAEDIIAIVMEMGHIPTGIARTHAEALALAARDRPDLILADIKLADDSSGVDAVDDILRESGNIPVMFITAFPERLLTGKRSEPAFLIPKPYTEQQLRSAISQAMFFASTETLSR